MFKKIKSLLDTKIGICSSSERSRSERLQVSKSIKFTDWDDLPKRLYVIYQAELRPKRQNARKPGRREGAVTASPQKNPGRSEPVNAYPKPESISNPIHTI